MNETKECINRNRYDNQYFKSLNKIQSDYQENLCNEQKEIIDRCQAITRLMNNLIYYESKNFVKNALISNIWLFRNMQSIENNK